MFQVMDDERKGVLAFPDFNNAVTLLRFITLHARPFLLGSIRIVRLKEGEQISGAQPCVTYVIEGQAGVFDSEGQRQEVYRAGSVHGEEALLGLPTSKLIATSKSVLVLRLAKVFCNPKNAA